MTAAIYRLKSPLVIGKLPWLAKFARDYLAKRGLDDRAALKRKLESLDRNETQAEFGKPWHSIRIPYFGPDGNPIRMPNGKAFARARLFPYEGPIKGDEHEAKAKAEKKFTQPAGGANRLYLDPAIRNWDSILKDPAIPLSITEGEVKAMAANERGIGPCLAVSGVYSWITKVNHLSVPLPDLDGIVWFKRLVRLIFDADCWSKEEVQHALNALATELIRRGATVVAVVLPSDGESNTGLDDWLAGLPPEADPIKCFDELRKEPAMFLLKPDRPQDTADAFLAANYGHPNDGALTLRRWAGTWYAFESERGYAPLEEEQLRALLYEWLRGATESKVTAGHVGVQQYKSNQNRVNMILDALKHSRVLVNDSPPCWLDTDKDRSLKPSDLIVLKNGLLHVPTRMLHSLTPSFFSTARALPFVYEPNAPKPERWHEFMWELFGLDFEARNTVQQLFGLLLTSDRRYEKIFLFISPRRGGKKTLMATAKALLGADNVIGPALQDLSQNFGLAQFIDKPLAIFGDERLSGDQRMITKRLLSISGNDVQTIDRKFKDPWTGVLPTQLVILSNEMPKFADASGALVGRLIPIVMKRSFYDREDLDLLDKLLRELPGIFNWALAGLDRLRKQGRFLVPRSGRTVIGDMEELASPLTGFAREHCLFGPEHRVARQELYERFREWAEVKGWEHTPTQNVFGRDLRAAYPQIADAQQRMDGKPVRIYLGVGLRGNG